MSRRSNEAALEAVQDVFLSARFVDPPDAHDGSISLNQLDARITYSFELLGQAILDLREQLEAARRERDAVADIMDVDQEAEAALDARHGEVPGA